MTMQPIQPIQTLLSDYQDFNPSVIDILNEEPSALEFMRYVARNKPFVLRQGAAQWKAYQEWNKNYLISVMKTSMVKIALTPDGNADAPLLKEDGQIWFVKPFEDQIYFDKAIEDISLQGTESHFKGPVMYAQAQNDNLREDYQELYADIPNSIPFARIALQKDPDAINFWLGNSKSTTSLHKDPYENIYAQIRGKKHLVLLPPIAIGCVNEQSLPAATYVPIYENKVLTPNIHGKNEIMLVPTLDEPLERVPFAVWDPDKPSANSTKFSSLIEPIRVTLDAGDMLYLPALWYHKVTLDSDNDGLCISVNYWYDMDFTGPFYSLCSMVRNLNIGEVNA